MKISEIFYSLQGEGYHTGRAAIFIRFYGCNRSCDFCDEPLHKTSYYNITAEEIIEKLIDFPSDFIVLTGGEPSISNLNPLIKKLQDLSYTVAVETNGYRPDNISEADWITYSPKELIHTHSHPFYDELKLVVNRHVNTDEILHFAANIHRPVFLQPQANGDKLDFQNIAHCIKLVKCHPQFKLSLQIHKLLNIP